MNQYVPPPKIARPVVLTDEIVKHRIGQATLTMNDGPFPVFGVLVGWQRLDNGVLAGIFVNPTTNVRERYSIDLNTGKIRGFGPPRAPKAR